MRKQSDKMINTPKGRSRHFACFALVPGHVPILYPGLCDSAESELPSSAGLPLFRRQAIDSPSTFPGPNQAQTRGAACSSFCLFRVSCLLKRIKNCCSQTVVPKLLFRVPKVEALKQFVSGSLSAQTVPRGPSSSGEVAMSLAPGSGSDGPVFGRDPYSGDWTDTAQLNYWRLDCSTAWVPGPSNWRKLLPFPFFLGRGSKLLK